MEQERKNLPIKTKIAAWWLIILGLIGLVLILLLVIAPSNSPNLFGLDIEDIFIGFKLIILLSVISVFNILTGILLFTKKRGAWIFAVFISLLETIFILGRFKTAFITGNITIYEWFLVFLIYILPIFFSMIPFALLASDKRKYWAMVRQRTAMKKAKSTTDEASSHPSGGL